MSESDNKTHLFHYLNIATEYNEDMSDGVYLPMHTKPTEKKKKRYLKYFSRQESKLLVSKCCICNKEFIVGDKIQAYLGTNDISYSWTTPITTDSKFQERINKNNDRIKRKHETC